ncbi:MAG TPA: hypothetical protein VFB22_12780 [Candidatus Baltobacteraceae bacterium]|nr:hypothetical protein [Candidatus Baltobacteraceae bacterium]
MANTLWDNNAQFLIALDLAETYNRDIVSIALDRRFEGAAYFTAQIFIALAALAAGPLRRTGSMRPEPSFTS